VGDRRLSSTLVSPAEHITSKPVDLEIPRRLRKAVVAEDASQQAAMLRGGAAAVAAT
jgi:hypothetical protein